MSGAIIAFLIYTGILASVGIWSFRIVEKVPVTKYEDEFYTAGRGLGGIVVALIIAGGLSSAGTFIAGPAMVYKFGYSWLLLNNFNFFVNLLLLAPIGIGVGIVARRVNALTYIDMIKARYESKALVLILATVVTIFLIPYMAVQFVGAARITVQMTGLGYFSSLALGSSVVLIYCVLGGMRGTSFATVIQGIVITAGCVILLLGTVHYAGGFRKATEILGAQDVSLLSPTKSGEFPPVFVFSMACMIGYFVVGMPHAMLGALTYRNTRALKKGIWMGGVVVLIWTLCLCLSGALGRAIKPDLAVPDEIGPWLAMHVMPGILGGVVLAGIVAGIQGTVAAKAILITSSVARNMARELSPDLPERRVKTLSRWTMAACLALSIALALFRPPLIQWIILFSIGGLEAATFAPLLLGMFWKRGTTIGAIASVVWGMIIYALGNTVFPQLGVWGAHPSLVSVLSALVVYVIVSLLTPRPSENVVWTFWGKPRSSP